MPRESLILGVAGVFFGVLVGWTLGSQQARSAPPPAAATASAAATAPAQTAAPFDEAAAKELRARIEKNSADAEARVQLGNMYFDSERFAEAARWYEDALRVNPKDADASTDLGISYYYMNQPDRALQQFERSLQHDPKHTKTLLNIGIVRAFGKQDLEGAAKAWQQVIEVAPGSTEARMATQALEGLRSAHPPTGKEPSGTQSK